MEIQEWRKFLIPYDQAVQELLVKFQNIILEYRNLGQYSPVELVTGKIRFRLNSWRIGFRILPVFGLSASL